MPTFLSAPARHASKHSLRYSSASTQGHTHLPGNVRTLAAFLAGISWHVPCRNEEHNGAAGTLYGAGLPSQAAGKLILRSGGSTFLPRHPAAAAVAPWSASLAPKNAPGVGGSRRGKRETMRAPTNLCFAFEEAEPYVSRMGSRRLLDEFSPKGQVWIRSRIKIRKVMSTLQ